MSCLFVYYLRCPACGHQGPSLPLCRQRWDPELMLPASNLVTGELDTVFFPATPETLRIPLPQLARAHTSETHPVAAPSLSGGICRLTPPLPCPRCSTLIETAVWHA
jgi:hypothetical protein